jgi:hypothetical protein
MANRILTESASVGRKARAIETLYDGHRFRSRLEARWAVLFNRMGLEWEYEPEGYELSNGKRYLPDFRLPRFGVHVEVKGDLEAAWRADDTLRHFRDDVGPILLLVGVPREATIARTGRRQSLWSNGTLYCFDIGGSGGGSSEHAAFIGHNADREPVLFADPCMCERIPHVLELGDAIENIDLGQRWDYAGAILAARYARFEHGEKP